MKPLPDSLVTEVQAKVCWGLPRERILEFLAERQVAPAMAVALVDELMAERHQEIREDGLKKIWVGGLLMAAPFAFWFVSVLVGTLLVKLFAGTVILGFYGMFKAITGLLHRRNPENYRESLGDL